MKRKNDAMNKKLFGKTTTSFLNKFKHTFKHMVKTITIMDDAYEVLKSKKAKDESFSDTIRRVCKERKVDLRQWFGALKGGEARAKAMNKEIMKERARTSKDIEERIKKVRQHYVASR